MKTIALLALSCAAAASATPKRYLEVLSPVYTVDGIYKSMAGPQSTCALRVLDGRAPELVCGKEGQASVVSQRLALFDF